jgi:hypothetical protein
MSTDGGLLQDTSFTLKLNTEELKHFVKVDSDVNTNKNMQSKLHAEASND